MPGGGWVDHTISMKNCGTTVQNALRAAPGVTRAEVGRQGGAGGEREAGGREGGREADAGGGGGGSRCHSRSGWLACGAGPVSRHRPWSTPWRSDTHTDRERQAADSLTHGPPPPPRGPSWWSCSSGGGLWRGGVIIGCGPWWWCGSVHSGQEARLLREATRKKKKMS